MAEDKLLTVRDVSSFLNITEKEVMDLAESGKLAAYKLAGVYLRFKKSQVLDFQKKREIANPQITSSKDYSFRDRLKDFFYFNDFYIFSIIIVILLIIVIFQGS